MINLSSKAIVFNVRGTELSHEVRAAFEVAVERHLAVVELGHIALDDIQPRHNFRAEFAKFVRGRILKEPERIFDENYIERVFEAYHAKRGHLSKELFETVAFADKEGAFRYTRSYASKIRHGLGMFLVALHSSGAITLPSTFIWPRMFSTEGKWLEIGRCVASELLGFIRTLEPWADNISHPAFEVVGGDCHRRSWFLSYSTRLLLATGWHTPEDVNISDLLAIKAAEHQINDGKQVPFAYGALLDVLNLAFPDRVSVTSTDWAIALRGARTTMMPKSAVRACERLHETSLRNDEDLLDEILNFNAAYAKPQRMKSFTSLPGLKVGFTGISKIWFDLEELYISKTVRENYEGLHTGLGWWNVYLFTIWHIGSNGTQIAPFSFRNLLHC